MLQRIARASLAFSLIGLALPGAAPAAPKAALALSNASATLVQTSDPDWTLEKSGEFDPATSTVSWTITATEEPTTTDHLVVAGAFTLTNLGSLPAPLGNLVVNLQTKGSKWTTRASDVADATNGDAATTALVVAKASSEGLASFSEGAASGALRLADASTGAPVSLAPQQSLAPGASVALRFSAAFDNNVLGLASGSAVRAELLLSFGNAGASSSSAANLDIDGSGAVDADEAHVRSLVARLGLGVPPATPGDPAVLLSDTLDDLRTTGTVTLLDATFDLDTTGGTVSALVDGGADGGTITNCAHLTGSQLELEACDTQAIGGETCTPGAVGCGWEEDDMHTWGQSEWGDNPALGGAPALLDQRWNTVYASSFGVLEVGIPGAAGFSIAFGDSTSALSYLPATGTNGPLTADLVNPTSSPAGTFGGEVVALELNTDFSAAGFLPGVTTVGSLNLCGVPGLSSMSVSSFLGIANNVLGGGSSALTLLQVASITNQINNAFVNGVPSTFAQDHLVNGPCPTTPWQPGDMLTFNQSQWGDPNSSAGNALATQYGSVYTSGLLEVGIIGAGGFSMLFTIDDAVQSYLPASGAFSALTSDLVDPTSSSSGVFGGEVVALQLNVDYSDADLLTSSTPFGVLRICNFAPLLPVHNMTVRQFLTVANHLLGGGSATLSIGQAISMASLLNGAFQDGSPSDFAQDHLVNGPCPTTPWQPGDMLTFNQTQWGDLNSTAGTTLGNNFDSIYGLAGLEVGTPGTTGFSMTFTLADAVITYLPASGALGSLTFDLVDPSSSSSGTFGGVVTALELNVDFSDAGALVGAVELGDLRICNFDPLPSINNWTVRELLAQGEWLLGGGSSAALNISQATTVAGFINSAFADGNPSDFAQDHLVNGPCP